LAPPAPTCVQKKKKRAVDPPEEEEEAPALDIACKGEGDLSYGGVIWALGRSSGTMARFQDAGTIASGATSITETLDAILEEEKL
jgi:hypothetical protein